MTVPFARDRDGGYEHPLARRDRLARQGVKVTPVWCEAHPGVHDMGPACAWPHMVGPSGPAPSVGHPYTVHD